jgi:hypothetical protein
VSGRGENAFKWYFNKAMTSAEAKASKQKGQDEQQHRIDSNRIMKAIATIPGITNRRGWEFKRKIDKKGEKTPPTSTDDEGNDDTTGSD